MNVIVADSARHGEALIGWLKLDPEQWTPVRYGQRLKKTFDRALLVRPLQGVEAEHHDWIMGSLIPRVAHADEIQTMPPSWQPGSEEPDETEFAAPEQRQVWAS